MSHQLRDYLNDPLLNRLYDEIRHFGPLKSASVDITERCNLRCEGCYFFQDGMDAAKPPVAEAEFDAFIDRERERGTNFLTVLGGEPSLVLDRLKRLYDNFHVVAVTNGLRKIPFTGFEKLAIGVSVWGDHVTDRQVRGWGKVDVFARALRHYEADPRVTWYYTTTPGNAAEIPRVVERCVANGNRVFFNFYGDLAGLGGAFDHRAGFQDVRAQIERMIERYPEWILLTSYIAEVVSSGRLYEDRWGYDVCGSVSVDCDRNAGRLQNGYLYNSHFRAYNADLRSTRRCCVGDTRDCSTCYDVWAHMSWIILQRRKHLASKREFTNWLTTLYMFYFAARLLDFDAGVKLLPEIHRRLAVPIEVTP